MTQEIQRKNTPENQQSLLVIDGEIYLPEAPAIQSDSREFHDLLTRCLPENTASEVLVHLHSDRQQWSLFQSMLAGLFVIAGTALVWYFFPSTPPKTTKMLPISLQTQTAAEPAISRKSPYKEIYDAALKLFEQKQYTECVRFLNDSAGKILNARKDNRDDRLLKLYFQAAHHANLPSELLANVRENLGKMQSASPDDPLLHLLDLEFNDAQNIKPEKLLHEIRSCGKDGMTEDLANARLRSLKNTGKKITALRRTIDNLPEKERDAWLQKSDLYRAQVLLCRWILEGGKGKEVLPDDNLKSPGVASREEALKILLQYPKVKEFLELRLFLAETIQAHLYGIDGFYWNSKRYFNNRQVLKEEIDSVKKELQKGLQNDQK